MLNEVSHARSSAFAESSVRLTWKSSTHSGLHTINMASCRVRNSVTTILVSVAAREPTGSKITVLYTMHDKLTAHSISCLMECYWSTTSRKVRDRETLDLWVSITSIVPVLPKV
jgi:hypothetical protein